LLQRHKDQKERKEKESSLLLSFNLI